MLQRLGHRVLHLPTSSARTMATVLPSSRIPDVNPKRTRNKEPLSLDHLQIYRSRNTPFFNKEKIKGARMVKRNITGSVFKLNLLAKQISGKPVNEALTQMKFSKKRRSDVVAKAIVTACNMAEIYHGLKPEELYVAEALTGRGSYSRRPHYRARGKFDFIQKTQSHLTVVVKEDNRDLSTTRAGRNPRRNKNRRRLGENPSFGTGGGM